MNVLFLGHSVKCLSYCKSWTKTPRTTSVWQLGLQKLPQSSKITYVFLKLSKRSPKCPIFLSYLQDSYWHARKMWPLSHATWEHQRAFWGCLRLLCWDLPQKCFYSTSPEFLGIQLCFLPQPAISLGSAPEITLQLSCAWTPKPISEF